MKLINREKALNIFKNIHPLDHNGNAYKSNIEQLPIIEGELIKWIPLNDGLLPHEYEPVLVTLINGMIDLTIFYGGDFEDYDWEELSAWARLPKPYKRGKNNERL